MNAMATDTSTEVWPSTEPVSVHTEEVTTPTVTHAPTFNYADMKPPYRTKAVPEALLPFLIEATAEGYTPPFYVNRAGTTRAAEAVVPGCPPIEPGGKALVFDDWGKPRVITVTGMHEGEIRGMFGSIPLQCRAWVAMSDEAPLTAAEGNAPNRLTDEEADALEAELGEWAKFLGWRAEEYGWCGTFENILRDVGVTPWRPGFKTVTLLAEVRIDAKEIALAEKIGGESEVRSVMATTLITLKDVSREDYENSRWTPLLEKAGYKNIAGNFRVHSKEAVRL